jgi:hypothetical protein
MCFFFCTAKLCCLGSCQTQTTVQSIDILHGHKPDKSQNLVKHDSLNQLGSIGILNLEVSMFRHKKRT